MEKVVWDDWDVGPGKQAEQESMGPPPPPPRNKQQEG